MRFPKFRDGQTAVVITHGLRKGQMAVVMTLVIATLLGVIALGSDVAVMYYNWMQCRSRPTPRRSRALLTF